MPRLTDGMEAQAALVGADGAVHLDAEAAIDLDIALVVKPGHAEHDEALGFGDALKDARRDVFRMALQHQAQRIDYFLYRLMKFRLCWVLRLHQRHNFVNVVARSFDSGLGCGYDTHRGPPRTLQLISRAVLKTGIVRYSILSNDLILRPVLFQSNLGKPCRDRYHPDR